MRGARDNLGRGQAGLTMALVVTAAVAFAVRGACADIVERRGQERDAKLELRDVTVTAVGEDGVTIKRSDGTAQVIALDRVREIGFAAPGGPGVKPIATDWARLQPVALKLWRARSRVERGDTALAEPLLEELFFGGRSDAGARTSMRPYLDGNSETALVVAEGLLRCRLARGDQAGALLPALTVTRLRQQGVSTDSYSTLEPVWDAATLLCPQLPPVLPDGPGTVAALAKLEPLTRGGDALTSELAALYGASIMIRPDGSLVPVLPLPAAPAGARESQATAILRAVLQTQQGDSSARASARAKLERIEALATKSAGPAKAAGGAQPSEGWLQAWTSFAEGSSLLRVDVAGDGTVDPALPDARRRGIVALLAVPARNDRSTPWLAGAALVVAASALERSGDPASATTVRRELDIDHPYHPMRAAAAPAATNARTSRGQSGLAPPKEAQ